MSNLQNDVIIERLYDEVADLLPALTPAQAERMDKLIQAGELEEARFYLNWLAKMFVPDSVRQEAEVDHAKRVIRDVI